MTAMRSAILPISTRRIPDTMSRNAMTRKREVIGERLTARKTEPARKAAMTNNIAGNNLTPIV